MTPPTAKQALAKWRAARRKLRAAHVALADAHAFASTRPHDPGSMPPIGWLTEAAVKAAEQAVALTDIAEMTAALRATSGDTK